MDPGVDAEVAAQLRRFAEQTADLVGVADGWGHVVYLNPAARKRLGVADASELTLADVFPPEEFTLYYEVARPRLLRSGAWSGVIRINVAGEGAVPMYVSTTAKLGPGGAIDGLVVHARDLPYADVGDAHDESEVDDGTRLLTRSAFDQRLRLSLAIAHRSDRACALVLIDIVGVRDTNEALGRGVTAGVMRALAGRTARIARAIDVVGRVGEQQLGLLLRHLRSHGEALRIAQAVYEALIDPPVTTAGGDVIASIGCGVAFSTADDDADALTQRASAAMSYRAAAPEIEVAAAPVLTPRTSDRAPTMDEFRVGLGTGEVRPFAQPVVDLGSGLVVGYRGLARWQHRRLGALEASAFIDMIADTLLAKSVDLVVARETAAVLALSLRPTPLQIYAPVSKRLIADVQTEQYLSEIAAAYGLSMSQFRLQVARRLLDDWSPALQDALVSLRDSDVALVLTGVEHGSEAKRFGADPFGELHLSRRVTNAVAGDPDAWLTVSEIVRIAHDRGLLVGATGVDDEQTRAVLREAGCDLASGDLYGRPEPANTID